MGNKVMKKILFLPAIALTVFFSTPVQAGYKYANVAGEYSVELPDAPTGRTIWADKEAVPYLDNPPKYGSVGEVASFKQVDPETNESFEVAITFLRADRDFLLSMTQARMEETLKNEYAGTRLDNARASFSEGSGTLKWATLTGFTVTPNNDLLFNATHYLTGETSLQMIKVSYHLDNKKFDDYYQTLSKSISYIGK
jgi:hypothetical protein